MGEFGELILIHQNFTYQSFTAHMILSLVSRSDKRPVTQGLATRDYTPVSIATSFIYRNYNQWPAKYTVRIK